MRDVNAVATEEEVVGCYRFILGREPESEAVVQRYVKRGMTLAELRRAFINSKEFRKGSAPRPEPHLPLAPEPIRVDSNASEAELAEMLARTGRYWERIGGEAPHWSVLTQDRFRPGRIAAHEATFYATGETDRALVQGLLARYGLSPTGLPRLLEFGCGVGRATLALAADFAMVTACDISAAHLAIAARVAEERGVNGIAWHRSSVAAPMPDAAWDVWYSRLVLQHNPPPVAAWLLRRAFAGLAPGGVAIFQMPTHRIGYRFALGEYLAQGTEPDMEMHFLPQPAIFALAAEAGLRVLEVREDTLLTTSHPSEWLSNLFVLQRPC